MYITENDFGLLNQCKGKDFVIFIFVVNPIQPKGSKSCTQKG